MNLKPKSDVPRIVTQWSRELPPLHEKRSRAGWWWAQSKEKFQLFEDNPYAHGYELLRRLPRFRQQPFFHNNPNRTWLKLSLRQQNLFACDYKGDFWKMGLVKGEVWVCRNLIIFDCRLPSNYLVEALEEQLCQPTPFAAGTGGWFLKPKAIKVKGLQVLGHDGTKQSREGWHLVLPADPFRIGLDLPLPIKRSNGDQIVSYFRTFVKDNPPVAFARHRSDCRKRFPREKPKRQPFNKLVKLALALMDADDGDISKLSCWLLGNPEKLGFLGIKATEPQITKLLYNSRQSLRKLAS